MYVGIIYLIILQTKHPCLAEFRKIVNSIYMCVVFGGGEALFKGNKSSDNLEGII